MTRRVPVSIVVPVYNDPAGVRSTVECLAAQRYPADQYEVLVVDNGSTDRTRDVIESLSSAHPTVELVVEDRIQGAYAARNAGLRRADGDVIVFLDADVTFSDDWLGCAVESMDRRGAAYLAGEVVVEGPPDQGSYAARFNRRTGFPVDRYIESFGFAPTCCLLVRRSVIEEVGPFDERLVSGGDLEFGNRVRDAGYRLEYDEALTVVHPARDTVRELASKASRVGRGRYQLRAFYPGRYGTPLAMLLNPLTYTPPIPWRVGRLIDDYDSLPRRERAAMYALLLMTKLARAHGKLDEAAGMGLRSILAPPGGDEGLVAAGSSGSSYPRPND